MSNSPLALETILSPNTYGIRTSPIIGITPHYMCWYTDAATCAESFVPRSRRASANYCIGKYGDIVLGLDESYAAGTSSSQYNDQRCVTIECSNYMETADGHVDGQLPDATWHSLVSLCADIVKRNGKKRLVYTGEADFDSLKPDEMILTKHHWFGNTDCPGPWFDNQFGRLANEVNAKLGHEPQALLTNPEMAAEICDHYIDHPAHGYSQPNRYGTGTEELTLSDGTEVTIQDGDVDCSRLIQICYGAIGVIPYDTVMWTGNEREVLLGNGFVEVSLDDVTRGDVLWRTGHTEMYLGNGMQGGARRSETYGVTGATGDQDGYEVVRSAYDHSEWTSAYRCTKVRQVTEEKGDGMLACIVDIKDDHRGYKKGMQVLWTAEAGFEYINHPDSIVLLDNMSKYYTGKPLFRVESSAKAPWIERLAQVTVNDKTKGIVK